MKKIFNKIKGLNKRQKEHLLVDFVFFVLFMGIAVWMGYLSLKVPTNQLMVLLFIVCLSLTIATLCVISIIVTLRGNHPFSWNKSYESVEAMLDRIRPKH